MSSPLESSGLNAPPKSESEPIAASITIEKVESASADHGHEKNHLFKIYLKLERAAEEKRWAEAEGFFKEGAEFISSQEPPVASNMDHLDWRLLYIATRFQSGINTFEELAQVTRDHPKRFEPLREKGDQLKALREFEEAIASWRSALDLATGKDKADLHIRRGKAFIDLGRFDEALEEGQSALRMSSGEDSAAELTFDALLPLAKNKQEIVLAFCFMEAHLKVKPLSSARFKLAYEYAARNYHEMAYAHYKIISDHDPSARTALNNLAHAAEFIELKFRGTEAYQKSMALGEPLAASNLAYRYLNAGLNIQARVLLTKHDEIPATASEVVTALSTISEKERSEATKEEKVLAHFDLLHNLLSETGVASHERCVLPEESSWHFPNFTIGVRVMDGSLSGQVEIEEQNTNVLYSALAGGHAQSVQRVKVSLIGRIRGNQIYFTVFRDKSRASDLVSIPHTNSSSDFVGIIDRHGKNAIIVEVKEKALGDPQEISVTASLQLSAGS
jgi:tetratricopeptide (TPR) repeat protein